MSTSVSSKRILKDLLEIERQNDLLHISAKPLENNIYEWHGNIFPKEGYFNGFISKLLSKSKN